MIPHFGKIWNYLADLAQLRKLADVIANSYGWCYNHIFHIMADVNAILIIWYPFKFDKADVIAFNFYKADVIALVADGITTCFV